jgi:hypothetical protein
MQSDDVHNLASPYGSAGNRLYSVGHRESRRPAESQPCRITTLPCLRRTGRSNRVRGTGTPGKSDSAAIRVGTFSTVEDGTFPPLGWHTKGEMGGVWMHPIKLLDGARM